MAISIVIIEVLNTGGNTYGKLKSPQGRHCELHLHTLRLEIMEYKAEKKSVMNLKVSFCVTQPSACRSLSLPVDAFHFLLFNPKRKLRGEEPKVLFSISREKVVFVQPGKFKGGLIVSQMSLK